MANPVVTYEPKQWTQATNPRTQAKKPHELNGKTHKTKEEKEWRNINKPNDPEKKMKLSRLRFNRLCLRGLIFVVWKRSSLFGFDLRIWVWSLLFGFNLLGAFVLFSSLWSSWFVGCLGLIFLESLLFLLFLHHCVSIVSSLCFCCSLLWSFLMSLGNSSL